MAKGRILINGHIRTAALDGNRIQIGTFTGGGVVSHFTEGEHAELTLQPYASDIATFGQNCRLTQLARYSYRNLLEGRPRLRQHPCDQRRPHRGVAGPTGPIGSARRRAGFGREASPRTCSRREPTKATVIPQVGGDRQDSAGAGRQPAPEPSAS